MDIQKLNAAEEKLCLVAENGRPAEFSGRRKKTIRAEVLRRLILGLKITKTCQTPRRLVEAGLVIRGASIDGRLDLDNATGPTGAPLPALVFEDCLLKGGLTACHAHLGRLSLEGSQVEDLGPEDRPTINLTGCQVTSELMLRRIQPAAEDGLLWVRAKDARVDGDLDICGAHLRAPPPPAQRRQTDLRRFGLNLSGAEIMGGIQALDALRVVGGVSMADCHVHGDVWMGGAVLSAERHAALRLQSAVIDGNFILDSMSDLEGAPPFRRFEAHGDVWMVGARFGGSLSMTGAQLTHGGAALTLDGVTVGGDFTLQGDEEEPARLRGALSANGLDVKGGLHLHNIQLGYDDRPDDEEDSPPPWVGPAIVLTRLRVGRQFRMSWISPLSRSPSASAVATSFPSEGERLNNSISMADAELGSLVFDEVRVNGDIDASGVVCHGECTFSSPLGLEVDGTANFAGVKVEGTLDLTGFRFGDSQRLPGRRLSLKDGHIGRALRVSENRVSRRLEPTVVAAREAALRCYPGWRLVEVLWRGAGESYGEAAQSAHLVSKDGAIRTLTGKSMDFHLLNGEGALRVQSAQQAEEYARLFCGFVRGEDGAFTILDGLDDVPGLIGVDEDRVAAHVLKAERAVAVAVANLAAATPEDREELTTELERVRAELVDARRGLDFDLEAELPPEKFTFEVTFRDGAYFLSPILRYSRVLFRSDLRIESGGAVEMVDDTPVTPDLIGVFPRHTDKLTIGRARGDGWVEVPTLVSAQVMDERRLRSLARRLAPEIVEAVNLSNAIIDLEDLSCDTLEDGGGAAWSDGVQLKLDRLTYRQVVSYQNGETWVRPRRHRRTLAERWRDLPAVLLRGEISRPLRVFAVYLAHTLPTLARSLGLTDTVRTMEDALKAPWRRRRDFLFRQYNADPDIDWRDIPEAGYRPQPYAEIIRVSRAMGDEEAAIEFEILKNKMEGRFYALRSRSASMIAGFLIAVMLVSYLAMKGVALPWRVLWFAVVFLFAARWAFIGNAVLRWMFGYLRRPLNALATLVAFFLIGWSGVHLANDKHRLVVDLIPVGSVIVADAKSHAMSIGSPVSTAGAHQNLACGGVISEPLYALDVFIPLIDLRQEDRCEVGVPDNDLAYPPPPGPLSALAESVARSTTFWDVAKAIYAVVGWIVISLGILTFAQVARRRDEQGF